MNIKAKHFTSSLVIALCASGVLTTAKVFASTSDNIQIAKNPEVQQLAQYYQNGRYNNNRSRSFNQLPKGYRRFVHQNKTYYTQDNQAYYSYSSGSKTYNLINLPDMSNNYPRSYSRLPRGYRKFISQNRTYYTQDNQAYYSYSSSSNAYVLINLPGFSIFF